MSLSKKYVAKIILLAAIYIVVAKFGLSLAFVTPQVTTVWPATGVALAAMLLLGKKFWPGIFIGAFIANVFTHEPVFVAIGIAIGNTLEALLGAYFLRRYTQFRPSLDRLRDVFPFVVFGAVVNTAIAATIGSMSLAAGGVIGWPSWNIVWLTWWVGDMMGALIIAPVILLWAKRSFQIKFLDHLAEPVFLGAIVFVASLLVFSRSVHDQGILLPSEYLLPFIVWAAIRFSQIGVVTTTFIISAVAVWGTIQGLGPFSSAPVIEDNLIQLQLFMFVLSITTMTLGAVVAERRKTEKQLGQRGIELENLNRYLQDSINLGRDKEKQLQATVVELEETRRAVLNVMEDLEKSRLHAEQDKAQAEALLDSLGEGIVAIDREGLTVAMNASAQTITGIQINHVLGQPWDNYGPLVDNQGRTLPAEQKPLFRALHDGQKVSANWNFKQPGGVIIPVAITATPIRLEGKVIGAITVIRDITKEAEIDRAKTEFVTLASHQLRTPLSAINWYTEMLIHEDKGKVSPPQKKYLEAVYHSSQRMVDLVNALLNVSRIDTGTFVVEPKKINVAELFNSVIEETAPDIKSRGLTLVKHYDERVPPVTSDPKLIRIVLQNLLSNAMKYTKVGKITITVTRPKTPIVPVAEVDQYLLLSVADTGCGIPAAQQGSIFTKLFRADNARNVDPDGSGLGLYIAKAVVDRSGGRIWFSSEENKGTTFFVLLPMESKLATGGNKPLL